MSRPSQNNESASSDPRASQATSHAPALSSASDSGAPSRHEPDYATTAPHLSLPFLTISFSHTVDHAGRDYYGVGASAGVAVSPPAGVSAPSGKLLRDGNRLATEREVHDFLCGDSISARAGVGVDAGITSASSGTAFEWGAATAIGVSAGFSYNWGDDCP